LESIHDYEESNQTEFFIKRLFIYDICKRLERGGYIMQPGQMAYDRAITVFSPDGRLFQVEYARVAVLRGTTTAGIKYKDGVVLLADKKMTSRLVEPKSIEKISQIDEHIGCATSGLVADARVLVDYARVIAQINKITYSERIPVELLVKKICDNKQAYTQYGGVRPFGTALLIGGCDDKGVHLYETDPSGSLTAYSAGSIGDGRNTVMEIFEEKWKENMEFDETMMLGLDALQRTNETPLKAQTVEVGVVEIDKKFYRMDEDEVAKYLTRITPPPTESSENKDKKTK
jgi:proteasome alpha subunit